MMRAGLLSFLLHGCLFVFLGWHWNLFPKPKSEQKIGNVHFVHAYVYKAPRLFETKRNSQSQKQVKSSAKQKKPVKTDKARKTLKVKKITKPTVSHKHLSKLAFERQQIKGHYDALLMKLHDLVQKRLMASNSLAEFARGKTVTVRFTLLNNGKIQNIEIIQSSGIKMLDTAVINILKELPPIDIEKQVIQIAQAFDLPIEFAG